MMHGPRNDVDSPMRKIVDGLLIEWGQLAWKMIGSPRNYAHQILTKNPENPRKGLAQNLEVRGPTK